MTASSLRTRSGEEKKEKKSKGCAAEYWWMFATESISYKLCLSVTFIITYEPPRNLFLEGSFFLPVPELSSAPKAYDDRFNRISAFILLFHLIRATITIINYSSTFSFFLSKNHLFNFHLRLTDITEKENGLQQLLATLKTWYLVAPPLATITPCKHRRLSEPL